MQKQKQILNQKLSLGPLQIQFLNLLQIPIVDLDKRIEKEIEENPAIEEHDEDDLNSEKTYQNNVYKNNESKTDFIVENFTGNSNTLAQHLHNQLIGSEKSDEEIKIVSYLIDSLDENGFLRRDHDSIINDYYINTEEEISIESFNNALVILKELEPHGVGARNLQECLIIQNEKLEYENKKTCLLYTSPSPRD